jgi:HPt (histidine-containing phosphotransfer) domain-containing protein
MTHVPASSVLDMSVVQALRELGGDDDPNLFDEVVELFLTDTKRNVEKLVVALCGRDAQALHRIAHTMKSSSANVGAMHLSKLCFEIEKLGRAGTCDGAQALVDEVGRHFEDVSAALAAARG